MRVPVLRSLSFLLLFTSAAKADVGDWDDTYTPPPAQRRSGFAAGLTFAAIAGGVSGYPREVAKIDVPKYEASTGLAGGAGGGFWVGAALRDWVVVGAGASFGTLAGGGGRLSNGGAFVLHLEGFPLAHRGGVFRDLGLVAEFGAGSRDVFIGSKQGADGGSTSYAAAGLLYEPVRVGHVSIGPTLLLGHQFSQTLTATLLTAGVQIAFYGGPG